MNILPTPKIIVGSGAINKIGNILKDLGAGNVLVVTDSGLIKAGIYKKIQKVLFENNIEVQLCDKVQPDPSIKLVQEISNHARRLRIKAVIGLGGGSSIDTAKVASALVTNTGNVNDYLGTDLLPLEGLPIIAIPTTAGTGSESTHIAILSDEEEKLKKGFVSVKLMPKYALLDPDLTLGLPPAITAATGMDALCHALESFTSVNASDYSSALSFRAMELISENIVEAFRNGKNRTAREKMLIGSLLAGIAFANAGVTAVHAFAYPLGGFFHVPHGLANSLMLPTIIRFNAEADEKKFAIIGKAITGKKNATAANAVERIEELSSILQLPKNLSSIDIPESSLEEMSQGVVKITRLLANNPREVSLDDARIIYRDAWSR